MRPLIFILWFTFLLPGSLLATHIVGGEMTYRCLGNNWYEIKLTIFRDCANGIPWFDDPASIGIFSNTSNTLIQEIPILLDSMRNDTLDPELFSDCFVVPPDVCVHTTYYTAVDSLPYLPGGYHLVYQRCCRNHSITNLIEPGEVGATYSILMGKEALQLCNSSPVFNNWPPLYICVNHPFFIDQSATDADGDSLVYKLCNPLHGASENEPQPQPPNPPPYDIVNWLPPYNAANMLGGPVPMTIHPATGLLTGTPNVVGQFVIGICVEEYRSGIFIGENRRDYQVNVGLCDITTAAFFAPEVICGTTTVQFKNESINANDFQWFFNDPANPGAFSALANPSYSYSDTGAYEITLVVEPGTTCVDTVSQSVHIFLQSLSAEFEIANTNCDDSLRIQLADLSFDTIYNLAAWQWTLEVTNAAGVTSQTSENQHPQFVITEPGAANVSLVVTAESGCMDTLQLAFPVLFFNDPDGADTTSLCLYEETLSLNPGPVYAGSTYAWSPPDNLDDAGSAQPIATPSGPITYSATITDPSGFCFLEKKVAVYLPPSLTVSPLLDTIRPGGMAPLTAISDHPTLTYAWSPPTGLSATDIFNPVATPLQTTEYQVTVTDENGCTRQASLLLVVESLCDEPYIFVPTGFSPDGDGQNEVFQVFGNDIAELYLAVYDRWGERVFETTEPGTGWDGTYRGRRLPPDAYGFYVRIRCFGGGEFFKKGNVTLLR